MDVNDQMDQARVQCLEVLDLIEAGRVAEAFIVTMGLTGLADARQECA